MSRPRTRERGRVAPGRERARHTGALLELPGLRRAALLGIIALAFAGLLVGGAVLLTTTQQPQAAGRPRATPISTSGQIPQGGQAGEVFPILASPHVPAGTRVTTYNSDPPTSGPHWPQPQPWGIVTAADPPDELFVHDLEHGGIWISYRPDIAAGTRARLEDFARAYPDAVVLSPRPRNDRAIVLASWGRLLRMDVFDEQRMVAFLSANINRSPERLARIEQPALAVGQLFPEFTATEVDGGTITRDTLKGKPAIVWFTTTYCVPCQVGARRVATLDDELGGNAFDVLVLFVDPKERPEDLREWRRQFAREDWKVALDLDLARRVELRYLDTKYLLDREGVIHNIDVAVADERYLQLIRGVVQERR